MDDEFQPSRFRGELYWQWWLCKEMKRLYQDWYTAVSPPPEEEKVDPCVVVIEECC